MSNKNAHFLCFQAYNKQVIFYSLQLALLAYVHRGEESKDLYKAIIAAKVLKGIYDDLTDQDHLTKARVRNYLFI